MPESATTATPTLAPTTSGTGIILPPMTTATATLAGSASSNAAGSSTSSGGLSKGALIAIIVGSVVAGIIIIWTIIRKVKFSPSKRFENKLAPIEYIPGERGGAGGDADSFDEGLPGDERGYAGYAGGLHGNESEEKVFSGGRGAQADYSYVTFCCPR